MNKLRIFRKCFLIFIILPVALSSQSVWTIGPMLHVNFGNKKARASFAIEAAYWNYTNFPYSIDFAIEFEKKKVRLYTEAQTGVGFAGISAGPVLEFQKGDEKKTVLGFQSSIWGNYFWGFDFRMRFIDKHTFICPGTYVKIPFGMRDENGEKHESSGSSGGRDWD